MSSILDYFAPNVDVVGIYDAATFQQVFADARPLKATVRETSRVMYHPAETGVQLADHHIIEPKEIDIPLLISQEYYASMYQQIKNAFLNSTLLSVQTRTDVYANMIVADMPHDESPDVFDSITLALHLKEILFVAPITVAAPNQPANYAPADPANSNTAQNGEQQPQVESLQTLSGTTVPGAW